MNYQMPVKRKKAALGLRERPQYRSQRHQKHVRSFTCFMASIDGHVCNSPIRCCHDRVGTDGATNVKPSDYFSFPGCDAAHAYQHQIGEAETERRHGMTFKNIESNMIKTSPVKAEILEHIRAHRPRGSEQLKL